MKYYVYANKMKNMDVRMTSGSITRSIEHSKAAFLAKLSLRLAGQAKLALY